MKTLKYIKLFESDDWEIDSDDEMMISNSFKVEDYDKEFATFLKQHNVYNEFTNLYLKKIKKIDFEEDWLFYFSDKVDYVTNAFIWSEDTSHVINWPYIHCEWREHCRNHPINEQLDDDWEIDTEDTAIETTEEKIKNNCKMLYKYLTDNNILKQFIHNLEKQEEVGGKKHGIYGWETINEFIEKFKNSPTIILYAFSLANVPEKPGFWECHTSNYVKFYFDNIGKMTNEQMDDWKIDSEDYIDQPFKIENYDKEFAEFLKREDVYDEFVELNFKWCEKTMCDEDEIFMHTSRSEYVIAAFPWRVEKWAKISNKWKDYCRNHPINEQLDDDWEIDSEDAVTYPTKEKLQKHCPILYKALIEKNLLDEFLWMLEDQETKGGTSHWKTIDEYVEKCGNDIYSVVKAFYFYNPENGDIILDHWNGFDNFYRHKFHRNSQIPNHH